MILDSEQRELLGWYYTEGRTIREIADWRACSYQRVCGQLNELRAIFRSHGHELPRYNHGRPKLAPNLPVTAIA